jgi:hypothetical protein
MEPDDRVHPTDDDIVPWRYDAGLAATLEARW